MFPAFKIIWLGFAYTLVIEFFEGFQVTPKREAKPPDKYPLPAQVKAKVNQAAHVKGMCLLA